MTRDDILDICRRWQDAFARRDLDGLAALYADDAVLESPLAGTVIGREALAQAHGGIFAAFPNLTQMFEEPLVDGHRAAIAVESSGAHTAAIMGLPPSGRPFRLRLVFLLEVRDGLIVRDRRIYDFTGLLVQVGVLKAKPA
jgi:steroid delta-isomerase-like uncharacterized protein